MTDSEIKGTKQSGKASWNARRISTVVAVVFWIWFLGSLALVKRYPWLDAVWNAVWILLLVVASIWVSIQRFRGIRGASGYIGYRGVPRWLAALFTDGTKPEARRLEKH
jgi:succinate dehydrogenase hydrophobic anchor subunit